MSCSFKFIVLINNIRFLKKRGLLAQPFDAEDDENGNQQSHSQRHFNNKRHGAYSPLEVDETPLLADSEKDDENVLFSKA